jgi:hypothetical protein
MAKTEKFRPKFPIFDTSSMSGLNDLKNDCTKNLFIHFYRVSHIEECKLNWLWHVEGLIILVNYGA